MCFRKLLQFVCDVNTVVLFNHASVSHHAAMALQNLAFALSLFACIDWGALLYLPDRYSWIWAGPGALQQSWQTSHLKGGSDHIGQPQQQHGIPLKSFDSHVQDITIIHVKPLKGIAHPNFPPFYSPLC